MNRQYTDQQIEKIRFHEEEAAYFRRWTLGAFALALCCLVWLLKTNNMIALAGTGLSAALGSWWLVQLVTALNSRDNARGYGNTLRFYYLLPLVVMLVLGVYMYFK